ncbi:MAG: AraC family transcriptional regulator, partial [Myxococcota bacterium]
MSTRTVCLLALPGVQALDLFGPMEVFEAATHHIRSRGGGADGYRTRIVSSERSVLMAGRVTVSATPLSTLRGPIDTLLVGGALSFIDRTFNAAVLRWLRRREPRTRRIGSICTGAFVLAQAGLLAGRRATTHWMAVRELQERHPDVVVEADALYVVDGSLYTSAGVSAG